MSTRIVRAKGYFAQNPAVTVSTDTPHIKTYCEHDIKALQSIYVVKEDIEIAVPDDVTDVEMWIKRYGNIIPGTVSIEYISE